VEWLARRRFPLLATIALVAFEMLSTLWWGPALLGVRHWSLPEDLWGTLVGAQRLLHGSWSGLYTEPTALVSFPGTALILVPLVALMEVCGIPLGPDWSVAVHPAVWLLAGPYEVAIGAVALFAADSITERAGVTPLRRLLLSVAEAVALWGVAVRWGHPEDAVAVGLFLYGASASAGASPSLARGGWLIGAAIAVQPLVLLAVPIVLAVLPWRRMVPFLVRAALPGAVLLGVAAAANWPAVVRAVTHQPNYPSVDHPTLWAALAPRMNDGSIAAGPARLLAITLACGCALCLRRRWAPGAGIASPASPAPGAGAGGAPEPGELYWWIAVALALRSVFEPVMVAYYLWPVLAVALIAAALRGRRLVMTSLATTAVTLAAQVGWHGPWAWWAPMLAGLAITLTLARLPARRSTGQPATKMQNGWPAGSA
jgi:hypothetical protein